MRAGRDARAAGRCAAAQREDPTPCDGPADTVTVLDRLGHEVAGCVHHAARLLAGLDGGRVHPFAPVARAVEVYVRARALPPRAWEVGL
ncbi:hypothetical protein ACFV3R_06025 [Streptomyces sp. NPDC059740]|uniref:hypothetical protein n=1 Tax=Streptomyces sp. NPDC059740 TaxID=3346926 RepID=UPI003663DEEA